VTFKVHKQLLLCIIPKCTFHHWFKVLNSMAWICIGQFTSMLVVYRIYNVDLKKWILYWYIYEKNKIIIIILCFFFSKKKFVLVLRFFCDFFFLRSHGSLSLFFPLPIHDFYFFSQFSFMVDFILIWFSKFWNFRIFC